MKSKTISNISEETPDTYSNSFILLCLEEVGLSKAERSLTHLRKLHKTIRQAAGDFKSNMELAKCLGEDIDEIEMVCRDVGITLCDKKSHKLIL